MTIELSARITYTAARARHRWSRRRRGHAPTVVFAMAKTGSSSIVAGLREAGIAAVHHVHDLDPAFLDQEEAEYRWSGRPWRIWDAQQLLRHPPTVRQPWRVISVVRDPIAQAISAFFQPGVRRGYLHDQATVEGLRERFGDRLDRLPLHWFETHLHPALGIDVYASAFDPGQGHQIIETPTVRLLLLRCEDLDAGAAGLARLLGRPQPVPIPRLNVGAEKQHADLYRAFRQSVRPTAAQLDHAYGSRLVRHFYSGAEIDRFRALWSGDPSAAR